MNPAPWEPQPWMQLKEIPRLAAEDTDDFRREIIRARTPVIVRGWLDDWDAVENWSVDYFIEKCGDNEIRLRNIGVENGEFRSWFRETTVREWLGELKAGQKDNLYLAEVPLHRTLPEMVGDIGTVPYGNQDPKVLNFMMGRTTYAPLHFHERHDAVAVQVVGTKSWVLYGPAQSKNLYPRPWFGHDLSYANVDLEDLANVDLERYPRFREAQGYHFTTTPGDALFIPMHWWHAVYGGPEFNVLLTDFFFSEATDSWTYPFPGLRLWARKLQVAAMARSLERGSVLQDVKRALRR